jgi:hypothetical protein
MFLRTLAFILSNLPHFLENAAFELFYPIYLIKFGNWLPANANAVRDVISKGFGI